MLHIQNSSPIPLEEAQRLVFSTVRPLPVIHIPLSKAYGYCLAETIKADHDVPMFDRSSMDGYALRAEDVKSASASNPVKLRIIEEVPAGHVPQQKITPGTASRIMTGAPIPKEANAVVKVEETKVAEEDGQSVWVYQSAMVGESISRRGQDVEEGKTLLEQGTLLGPVEVGLLAISVSQLFRCILNRRSVFFQQEYDFLGMIFEKIGAKIVFWKTLIRPGMPALYGTWQDKPIFALPGNPASSYINARLYLLPAIRYMCGWREPLPKRITVVCDETIEEKQMPHTRFLRGLTYVSPSGELRVKISTKQSSSVLSSFLESNCLVRVPGGKGYDTGELVEVELLGAIEDRVGDYK